MRRFFMKKYLHLPLLLLLVAIVGCQEKTKTKTVYQNPGTTIGGTLGGTTIGGTTIGGTIGGTNPNTICTINPALPYCQTNYCTAMSTLPLGCVVYNGTRVNCYLSPSTPGCSNSNNVTSPGNSNWGVFYPPNGNAPTGSGTCTETYVPSSLSSALETRKGTVTIAGLHTIPFRQMRVITSILRLF
jgi:hypothetical protein